MNRWDHFDRYCTTLTPLLERMGRTGVLIDREKQSAFIGRMRAEHAVELAKLQSDVPGHLRLLKVWKRKPKDPDAWPTVDGGFARLEGFNPGSWQQVAALAKAIGAKLPPKEDAEDEDDVSTERKYLVAQSKRFPVFKGVLRCRERGKLISSYNWPVNEHGRVTTTYGFHPSTWRKSSRKVNLQTIPKRSDLADEFRQMIVAAPGHVLIEADAAAIEAVLVGYLASSPRYIRLAKAGVHGWVTAALHGEHIPLDIADAELAQRCRAAKRAWPDDYERCKRVVHLSNYGGTPRRIHEEYPDEFPAESDARALQQFYFSTGPGKDVKAWQIHTVEIAHHDKALSNHFGLRHRFFGLYTKDSRTGKFRWGDDAKRAIAFVPQSDASFIQSEVLLALAPTPAVLYLRLIVHDSIICEVPQDEAVGYKVPELLYNVMTQPIPQLEGLAIGCEVKVGYNLGKRSPTNPGGMAEVEFAQASDSPSHTACTPASK